MPVRRLLVAVLILAASLGSAAADELTDFHAAVETFSTHHRVAVGYLRTGNRELASVEIDSMRDAWSALVARFGKDRPPAFRDNPLYVTTFVDVPTRLVGVSLMLTMGRADLASSALLAVRQELSDLRRASGIEILPDCVLRANAAMERLIVFADAPPDWNSPTAVVDLNAAAQDYGGSVARCAAMAPEGLKSQPEFRRLIDGVAASLARVPNVIAARDGDLLRRLVAELRSFDDLLTLRYG